MKSQYCERGLEYWGWGYRFFNASSSSMCDVHNETIGLTVTSPPYWNAIDYDKHVNDGFSWYRSREYGELGNSLDHYFANLSHIFWEVFKKTIPGGFCAVVIGTLLHNRKHIPLPFHFMNEMLNLGWEFHQDIIWNKVTGGVKRAGSFIKHQRAGYYYPNIMKEYILVFRKPGPVMRGSVPDMPIDDVFKKDIANDIWHIAPVPPNQIDHPCPFPEELARRLILLYSDRGDWVLDPFLGSGQTAVAARRNGRLCVGYDIEKKYVEMAYHRINNLPDERTHDLIPGYEKLAKGEQNA